MAGSAAPAPAGDGPDPEPDADGDDLQPMPMMDAATVPIPNVGQRRVAPDDLPVTPMPDVPTGGDDIERERAMQALQAKVANANQMPVTPMPVVPTGNGGMSPMPPVPVGTEGMTTLPGAGGFKPTVEPSRAVFDDLGLPVQTGRINGAYGQMASPPPDSLSAILRRATLGARRR